VEYATGSDYSTICDVAVGRLRMLVASAAAALESTPPLTPAFSSPGISNEAPATSQPNEAASSMVALTSTTAAAPVSLSKNQLTKLKKKEKLASKGGKGGKAAAFVVASVPPAAPTPASATSSVKFGFFDGAGEEGNSNDG
jgi:hypothetical protein